FGLAVNQAHFASAPREGTEVGKEIVAVGVPGEAIDLDDFKPLVPAPAVEADRWLALQHLAAQAIGRLVADQDEAGTRVVDVAAQVLDDASTVAHAARGNNHARPGLL